MSLQDDLRRQLTTWADGAAPPGPSAADIATRAQRHHRRQRTVLLATTAGVVLLAVAAARWADRDPGVETAVAGRDAPVCAPGPAPDPTVDAQSLPCRIVAIADEGQDRYLVVVSPATAGGGDQAPAPILSVGSGRHWQTIPTDLPPGLRIETVTRASGRLWLGGSMTTPAPDGSVRAEAVVANSTGPGLDTWTVHLLPAPHTPVVSLIPAGPTMVAAGRAPEEGRGASGPAWHGSAETGFVPYVHTATTRGWDLVASPGDPLVVLLAQPDRTYSSTSSNGGDDWVGGADLTCPADPDTDPDTDTDTARYQWPTPPAPSPVVTGTCGHRPTVWTSGDNARTWPASHPADGGTITSAAAGEGGVVVVVDDTVRMAQAPGRWRDGPAGTPTDEGALTVLAVGPSTALLADAQGSLITIPLEEGSR